MAGDPSGAFRPTDLESEEKPSPLPGFVSYLYSSRWKGWSDTTLKGIAIRYQTTAKTTE